MTSFTDTWNSAFEAIPADVEDISLGASRIRSLKGAISERLEVDHSWAGDEFDGEHKQVTFFGPISTPSNVANKGHLYLKDVSSKAELHFQDEDGNEIQLSNTGQLNLFPSGTRMIFQQTAAPTGWTKDTTDVDDRALRVVSGAASSGGTDGFSVCFSDSKATEDHALTVDEIPSHTHTGTLETYEATSGEGRVTEGGSSSSSVEYETDATGGGEAHTHDITLDLQYLDVIIAQKD